MSKRVRVHVRGDDLCGNVGIHSKRFGADLSMQVEEQAKGCHARSDKHWIADPQGIAREPFHTLENVPAFSARARTATAACCPARASGPRAACC